MNEPSPPLERLYTLDEVAKYFSVTKYTVRQWLRDGTLRGIKIGAGKYWRVSESALKEFATGRYGDVKNSTP